MSQIYAIANKLRAGLMSAGHAFYVSSYAGKYKDLDATWGDFSKGVPWTSSGDVGPTLNGALAQFVTAGGARMQLPIGTANLATTLACSNWQGIALVGRKFGDFSQGTTALKWIGASGTAVKMIDWTSSSGTITTQASELSGFLLEANGLAGIGAYARGLGNSVFDLMVHNPTYRALDLDVIAGTQYYDVANNKISLYFLADSAAAVNASGLVIGPGSPILDTHSNEFYKLRAQFQNGVAFDIGNTDSNVFYSVYCSRILSGTGTGMVFRAGASVLQRCRSNTFYRVDMPSAPMIVEGTNVAATPSQNNHIAFYNYESGMPAPVLGTGATLGGFDNTGQPIGNLGLAGPRVAFTPVITSTQGSGLVATGTCFTRKVGPEVDIEINYNISQAGSGSEYLKITLPYTCLRATMLFGRTESNGKMLQGFIPGASNFVLVINSDNAYPGGAGNGYLSGRYEANA